MSRLKHVLPLAAVLLAASGAWACSTPVFRYAMYNWPVSAYRVFSFHEGPQAKPDQEIDRLAKEAGRQTPPLNLVLVPVDVGQKDQFDKLPAVVRKVWEGRPAGVKSLQAVFNPLGQLVYSGTLKPADVKAMIQSPARKRMTKLLHEGNAGVFVLLAGPKADANRQAELTIDELLRRVEAGEVALPTMDGPAYPAPPERAGNDSPADDPPRAGPPALKVGRLTLSRADPAETWLVRSLTAVEDDLGQLADQPMIFAVYGRARVMPPFVGKGITADNLAEAVAFLGGACSCVIKDENPGVDLLVAWDWDATAEALAMAEEEQAVGGLGYSESPAPEAKKSDRKPDNPATKPAASAAEATNVAKPQAKAGAKAAVKADAKAAEANTPTQPAPEPVAAAVVAGEPERYTRRQLRTSLYVVGMGAVVVFALGMLWVRRSRMAE